MYSPQKFSSRLRVFPVLAAGVDYLPGSDARNGPLKHPAVPGHFL
jgi:hypothetical protein